MYLQLVFQTTVRMAFCQEPARDKKAIEVVRLYLSIEQNNTPASLILPWFPGPAKKAKKKATLDLYLLLRTYATMRREAKTPSTDPIDVLIASGDSDNVIIGVSALNRICNHIVIRFAVSLDRDGVHFRWCCQHWHYM